MGRRVDSATNLCRWIQMDMLEERERDKDKDKCKGEKNELKGRVRDRSRQIYERKD